MTLLPPHPGDLLSAWLDGELSPGESTLVAAHLESCPACAAEREEVEASRTALRGLPQLDVPQGVLRPLPAVHVGDLISARLDDEVDADLVPGIEAHLAACPACTAEHDEVAWARTALRRLPPVEPPVGVLRLGPSGPREREAQGPSGPREREAQGRRGPSGPAERDAPPMAWPAPAAARRVGRNGFRPPAGRRLGPRQVVAASAAVAAAGFGVLGLVGRSAPADTTKPAVATFVADHSTSSPGPDAVSGLAPVAVPVSFTR